MKKPFAALFCLAVFGMFVGDAVAQWEDVFNLGAPGRAWTAADGGVQFVQEAGVNDRPGSATSPAVNQQADDDYYTAGTYPAPIGSVAEELVSERAFAGLDNRLTFHFNLPATLTPADKFRFSYHANNLDTGNIPDPRYGIEIYANGTLVAPEYVMKPADVGAAAPVFTTGEFTAADVGFVGGAGSDNEITLQGINYSADGGGDWMGLDYHNLEIMPVPEPGGLSMLLCGLFWTIPLVCWEKNRAKK